MVDASQADTARSARTVANAASMLPLSKTVFHPVPCSVKAARTAGRNAQVSATSETGKGRFRCAVPGLGSDPDEPLDAKAFARGRPGQFLDHGKVNPSHRQRFHQLRGRCAHQGE